MRYLLMFLLLTLTPFQLFASEAVVNDMLRQYQAQGAADFSAERGKAVWHQKHIQAKSGKQVNCASCHGSDLTRTGKHVRTGKLIKAMAPSANPERLGDPAKIEKWFLRNCTWTLGRECTPREKGDVLLYLQGQ